MRIRITRATVCLNRIVERGEVLDESCGLDDRDALTLIRLGKAEVIEPKHQEEPKVITTETAMPIVRGKRKRG